MVDPSSALTGRTRETKIRRDARGRWFDGEDPITHVSLTRAFDAWLVPAPDGSGRWALSNAINWAFVTLEGPPRFVRRAVLRGGEAWLTLSDGREVALDPSTLRQGEDGALYCEVPSLDAGPPLVARFDASAAMQLEGCVEEDEEGVYLALGGQRVRPPRG